MVIYDPFCMTAGTGLKVLLNLISLINQIAVDMVLSIESLA